MIKRYTEFAMMAEWRTFDVVGLCKEMREADDYSALPILADALQEAGYPGEADLAWLRLPEHDADEALHFVVHVEGGEALGAAEWIDLNWSEHFYVDRNWDESMMWVQSVRAADSFLRTGTSIHLNYDTPDVHNTLATRRLFWENYQKIRGKVERRADRWTAGADTEFDDTDGFYSCSC